MEHRDRIILQKVLSEIEIAQKMMAGCSLEQFEQNEMLKQDVKTARPNRRGGACPARRHRAII